VIHTMVEKDGVFIATTATVLGDVRLGRGVNVWFGAVIRADLARITVGEMTNVQDLVVMHTDPGLDLTVGAHVTIGHQAILHGTSVGDRCLIGMQCCLLAGSEIGEGCIVAAGALVREGQKIPPRSLVAGLPARVVGPVTDLQYATFVERARCYLETAKRHAAGRVDPKYMTEFPAGPKPPGW